jgi:hypothetical protein
LTVGHMAALTYDFLGQTLERWQKVSPGVVVDCVEMDPETQKRALLDGRIAVGILVLLSNRRPAIAGRSRVPERQRFP